MPVTSIYAFPYPALSDPPNGPAQFQALAEAIESKFVINDATDTTLGDRITDLENDLNSPPIAYLTQSSAQSIPTATFTAITFNTEVIDTAGGHSDVTNNSRYTAQKAGYYLLGGGVTFASNSGFKATRWAKNGSSIAGSQMDVTSSAGAEWPVMARTIVVQLSISDYVELQGYHEVGVNHNTGISADTRSSMSVVFLSV